MKQQSCEQSKKGFNKKLLVIPLILVLIVPVSYFLLKETSTEGTNEDIYTLKNEEESWPTFQGAPQRTRVVHGEIPDNVEVKWKFEASGGPSIACAYGRVYFGDYFGYFYCLDGDIGELIWKFHPDESKNVDMSINSTPTIYDKKVYFYNYQGEVYCLSALDGSKVWEYKVQKVHIWGVTAVVDGKFYMICDGWAGDERLICLDANTGNLIWDYRNEKEFTPHILTIGDNELFLNSKNFVMCIDKDSGKLVWDKEFEKGMNQIVYSKNKIYFWSGGTIHEEGRWYCLNTDNEEILWEKDHGYSWNYDFSIFNEKLYLSGYYKNEKEVYFYSVDANTGEIIWRKKSDHGISTPITDGIKVVSINKAYIICLSTKNGEELWRCETGEPHFDLAYMDKKIYYWGNDGYVYCIGER